MRTHSDLNVDGVMFVAHDWQPLPDGHENKAADVLRCALCHVFSVGKRGADGWCKVPGLLDRWAVGDIAGPVHRLDFKTFEFGIGLSPERFKFGAGARMEAA